MKGYHTAIAEDIIDSYRFMIVILCMQRVLLIILIAIGIATTASAGELTKVRLTATIDSMLTAKRIYISDERGDNRDYSVVNVGDSVAYETVSNELHREFIRCGDTLRLHRQEWATSSVAFDVAPMVTPLPIGVTQHISARVRRYVHDHYMLEGDLTAEHVEGITLFNGDETLYSDLDAEVYTVNGALTFTDHYYDSVYSAPMPTQVKICHVYAPDDTDRTNPLLLCEEYTAIDSTESATLYKLALFDEQAASQLNRKSPARNNGKKRNSSNGENHNSYANGQIEVSPGAVTINPATTAVTLDSSEADGQDNTFLISDSLGRVYCQGPLTEQSQTFQLTPGEYIVQLDGQSYKVIVY